MQETELHAQPAHSSGAPPGVTMSSDPPPSLLPVVERTPLKVALGLLKTARPHQWVKNVFVLAPVVFAKEIFEPSLMLRAGGAFVVFCLISAAVYMQRTANTRSSDFAPSRLGSCRRWLRGSSSRC
jgi:hypothetical protein